MNDLNVKHGGAHWPIEGTPICTKRSADVRFSQYSENLWLLRTACAEKDSRVLCKVYHLAEGDCLTHVLAAVCKRDYDPAVDIDRYLVDCFGSHGRLDRCPVFEAIRAALERERARRVNLGDDCVDDARCADVGYGDGYVGPILDAFDFNPEFIPSEAQLQEICLGCDKCRHDGSGHADETDQVVAKVVENRPHGGIIAFFKRLIGRRK